MELEGNYLPMPLVTQENVSSLFLSARTRRDSPSTPPCPTAAPHHRCPATIHLPVVVEGRISAASPPSPSVVAPRRLRPSPPPFMLSRLPVTLTSTLPWLDPPEARTPPPTPLPYPYATSTILVSSHPACLQPLLCHGQSHLHLELGLHRPHSFHLPVPPPLSSHYLHPPPRGPATGLLQAVHIGGLLQTHVVLSG